MQGQPPTRVCVPKQRRVGRPGREYPPGRCRRLSLWSSGSCNSWHRAISGVSGFACQPADAGGPFAVCPEFGMRTCHGPPERGVRTREWGLVVCTSPLFCFKASVT